MGAQGNGGLPRAATRKEYMDTLASLGRNAAALRAARYAVGLRPDDAVSRLNLGMLHLGMGDEEAAEAHFEEARRLDPRTDAPAPRGGQGSLGAVAGR